MVLLEACASEESDAGADEVQFAEAVDEFPRYAGHALQFLPTGTRSLEEAEVDLLVGLGGMDAAARNYPLPYS